VAARGWVHLHSGDTAGDDWTRAKNLADNPNYGQPLPVWDSDSEIRYFIEKVNERWFRVTCSNRMGPAQFELAAPLMSAIETYFYGLFGADVRYRTHMKQATTDQRRRDDRFVIRKFPETDPDYFALFQNADRDHLALYDAGQVVAVDGFGKVMAEIRLTQLAVYLSVSTAEIKYSFQHPDGVDPYGTPLLIVNERGVEGEGTGAGAPA
jgi:hypothetical protein